MWPSWQSSAATASSASCGSTRILEIEIHGQGVENHAPGIYHLANVDTA